MSDKDEYIRRLEKIERDIEWLIQYLSKENEPSPPTPYIPPAAPFQSTSVCSKCGINWEGSMGYYCASLNCPMQYNVSYTTSIMNQKG
jgi:hypothetical protein